MALFKIPQGSRGIMRLLLIQLLCCFGWFSSFALAQFDISEGVTGSVNFPALGITCVSNLAVFVTTLIRERLDLEMGARDALEILSSTKLNNIERIKHGNGLITTEEEDLQIASAAASVVMLSNGTPNWSMRQFMKSNAPIVHSIQLQFLRLQDAVNDAKVQKELLLHLREAKAREELLHRLPEAKVREELLQELTPEVREELTPRLQDAVNEELTPEVREELTPRFQDAVNEELTSEVREELTPEVTIQTCECVPACNCIVFWTAQQITSMLARRMPGILKSLSSSLCLLPCLTCLTKGCHGCHKEGLLRVEADEGQRLRESESKVVSKILNDIGARSINAEGHICICIPIHGASSDVWTELLVRSLRTKDAEGRGVRVKASEALEGYLAGRRGGANESVEYNISSLIVPRLTEVVINLVLTFWFRVDGFSSALLARRTIRDYLVDTKGSGLAANAFLTKVKVKSDDSCSQVCQVLFFRGNHVRIITVFTGCVNLICSLGWAVLISFDGGADTSPPPSMTIVVVIIAAIATALGMDIAGGVFLFFKSCEEEEDDHLAGLLCGRPIMWQAFCVVMAIILLVISPILLMIYLLIEMFIVIVCQAFCAQLIDPKIMIIMIMIVSSALEIVCIVAGSAVAGTLGIKAFGRWVYAVLQILVWLKWAMGSLILTEEISIEFLGRNPESWGMMVYSSAFMLNAVLAGVRCKWEAWPWKDNHLFSRKLGP